MERWFMWVLLCCFLMAGVLSLYASPELDGLERVATDQGFIDSEHVTFHSLMPDYAVPYVEDESLAASLAGIMGTALMFVMVMLLGDALKEKVPCTTRS